MQLSPDWMLADSHLYIRRLPWTFSPSMFGGVGGYSASVTSVGSRHQQPSAHTSSRGGGGGNGGGGKVAAPREGGTWADVGGEMESEKMSFDEMLALSIAVSAHARLPIMSFSCIDLHATDLFQPVV